MTTDSQRLLAEYARSGSDAAFRELVARYIDLVYSAAVRLLEGDTHLAKDVAQEVFADLARKATNLSGQVTLGGWLHRHTCYVVAALKRSERRRQNRERQAVEMSTLQDHSEANLAQLRPILDEAINELRAKDRAAILLRFFEQYDFRSVGAALGSSENAAQKRVARALEELRSLLKRRGVTTVSAAALGTALAGEAVSAAPAGLAASVSSAALTTMAAGTGTTLTILKYMAMTKLKLGLISALAVAGVATPLVIQHQAEVRLRDEDLALRRQEKQLAQLQAENERLSNLVVQANDHASLPEGQFRELLRLRGEVTELRKDSAELTRLKEASARAKSGLPKAVSERSQGEAEQALQIAVGLSADGELSVAGQQCPPNQLAATIRDLAAGRTSAVRIMADQSTRHEQLFKAVEACQEAGVKKISLAIAKSVAD